MAKSTIAQALKIKNRQVKKVNELKNRIKSQNCHVEGVVPEFDIRNLWADLQAETEKLIAIKAAISAANAKLQPSIYRIAELRGLVAFWAEVDKRSGPQPVGYFGAGTPPNMVAEVGIAEAAKIVEDIERQIDE